MYMHICMLDTYTVRLDLLTVHLWFQLSIDYAVKPIETHTWMYVPHTSARVGSGLQRILVDVSGHSGVGGSCPIKYM